eukprot:5017224-Pleurochrysis_carterae.AAC.4
MSRRGSHRLESALRVLGFACQIHAWHASFAPFVGKREVGVGENGTRTVSSIIKPTSRRGLPNQLGAVSWCECETRSEWTAWKYFRFSNASATHTASTPWAEIVFCVEGAGSPHKRRVPIRRKRVRWTHLWRASPRRGPAADSCEGPPPAQIIHARTLTQGVAAALDAPPLWRGADARNARCLTGLSALTSAKSHGRDGHGYGRGMKRGRA